MISIMSLHYIHSCVSVLIAVPPEVMITGDTTVTEFGTLQLICTATGYPTPSITWLKRRGTELNILSSPRVTSTVSNPKHSVSGLQVVTSVLTIVDLTTTDDGEYVCEASNQITLETIGMNIWDVTVTGKLLRHYILAICT